MPVWMKTWSYILLKVHINVSCDGIFRKFFKSRNIAHFKYDKKFHWGYCTNITNLFWRQHQMKRETMRNLASSLLLPITWVCTWRNVCWNQAPHEKPWYVSNSIFVQSVLWYVSSVKNASWKLMKLPLFCQHLILGFDSRQRKECKEFPELLFYLLSSSFSSTKLYSSSPPGAFV